MSDLASPVESDPTPQPPAQQPCWKTVGVEGSGSCPELAVHSHCRRCPVYIDAGRALFERPIPDGYLDEWAAVLARPKEVAISATSSVLIFRVSQEWLALPARALAEVRHGLRIHTVPHRRGTAFLGLVNVQGDIQPCYSLHQLLTIEAEETPEAFIVAEAEGRRWVFVVDEVRAVVRLDPSSLRNAPALARLRDALTTGVFSWEQREVGLLAPERLLELAQEAS